jgi:cell division protein FtsZ
MGSGFGEGDDRAQEAAQEAVSSPLLDNVSIHGAKGVLINITGGMDLAIDDVTQISTIIQEEAGDEAEIIFGAVHDPTLEGKVRVTVIATGFDTEYETEDKVIRPDFGRHPTTRTQTQTDLQPRIEMRQVAGGEHDVVPAARLPERVVTREAFVELDIPTFIRRQMD